MSGDPPALSRFELATRELRALGITLIRLYGEYCVNYRNGTDATAVFLSDLADAIALGRAMAVVASAEGTAVPVSTPRRMTPKAIISSRRMIRAHDRRMRARALQKEARAHRRRMIRAHKRRMHTLALEKKARIQGTLQTAYEFFNRQLFCGQLPDCLITLRRKRKGKRMYGSRFTHLEGLRERRTDEIALNPSRFAMAGIEDMLSTLVHEMAHLWQHHFGTPSRAGYHNREWAAKMKEIGLHPSSTGAAGGKETGQNMSHYVIAGRAFATACAALVSEGFKLAWGETREWCRTRC